MKGGWTEVEVMEGGTNRVDGLVGVRHRMLTLRSSTWELAFRRLIAGESLMRGTKAVDSF